jgi:hypothetical protein
MPAFDGSLKSEETPAHPLRLDPQLPMASLGKEAME